MSWWRRIVAHSLRNSLQVHAKSGMALLNLIDREVFVKAACDVSWVVAMDPVVLRNPECVAF